LAPTILAQGPSQGPSRWRSAHVALHAFAMAPVAAPRRSTALARVGALAAGLGLLAAGTSFVAGGVAPKALRGHVAALAAAEKDDAPKDSGASSALVAVTEDTKITAASVLGGVAGLLVGGVWIGAALFAATAFVARQDNDASKALKGTAGGALEALNFGSYLNDRYDVTGKVGGAITDAVEKTDSKDAKNLLATVKQTASDADKELNLKSTAGSFVTSASDLAAQVVGKATELNEKYQITDQIGSKISQQVSKVSSGSKSSGPAQAQQ